MTKDALQKELQEKVREGVKPSDLKKLKRSKSADDIVSPSPPNPPLKKSQSQLEIPLQPNSKQQITNLQEQIQFHSQAAQNYLQSLQSAQARVSELETSLKNVPPSQLLQDQLREKQQEIEQLRKDLEQTNLELTSLKSQHSSLLDTNLTLKHQSLKDWFKQYQQTQKLEKELAQNVDYASNELLTQDKTISQLRTELSTLKLQKQSLSRDLELATKLAQLRGTPLSSSETNWTYLKYALYSLALVIFISYLFKNMK